jgi:hypothetical protein
MRKKDITLREFIHVYVTTQGSGGYGERPATRAKRLAEVIYGQPEVLDALREHPASGTAGIVTVKALRKEMRALEEAGDMFSAYQVNHGQEKTSQVRTEQEEQVRTEQQVRTELDEQARTELDEQVTTDSLEMARNLRTTNAYLATCGLRTCPSKSTLALLFYLDSSMVSWSLR